MEKQITFSPAFDKRHKEPDKNYGVHGAEMLWLLKGELGCVQFKVFTNWHLPNVQEEMWANQRMNHNCGFMFYPAAADLGYHSPRPLYEGQEVTSENCDYIGCPCYYDGSGLNAEPVLEFLISQGSDAVWKYLEQYYTDRFGELK